MRDVVELACELIRIPSPVVDGDEVDVASYLSQVFTESGIPAARRLAKDPRRPNLLTSVDFGSGGAHLILCGHLDTKPVGDAVWSVDPFSAEVVRDRLYGLGSGDMKAALAAMVVAVERLLADPPAAGRVSLLFTADEENGAVYGSQFLADELSLDADAMVIGEPGGIHADFDRLHVASRGLGRFDVTARARQGHSSLSALLGARNAGADVAGAVSRLHGAVLEPPPRPDGVDEWAVTVNAGLAYRGGWGYGVLPDHMTSLVEVRSLPGMTSESVQRQLDSLLVGAVEGADLRITPDASGAHWIDATAVAPAGGPLVRSAESACSTVFDSSPPLTVFPGTTDASWLAGLGIPCLPALGPGLLARAHGPDEWVSVAAVRSTVDLYEHLARTFLAADPVGGTHD
ncbi:M20 family metallopeptidase [Phycicoccus flavus]|uniref:M20 family metallopeptidase n=1 Tax=Phycicoccus flavus TaxID=2502783 RepID=A0A8T6R381_9MICO|nr:M20 family metallopeptidase [Phycicoccus flavus]NHA68242.1 M20 family metallopeptidase [Phycicoccus flavus]